MYPLEPLVVGIEVYKKMGRDKKTSPIDRDLEKFTIINSQFYSLFLVKPKKLLIMLIFSNKKINKNTQR